MVAAANVASKRAPCYHAVMTTQLLRAARLLLPLVCAASLAGCSPKYNWRDYGSPDATFRAMFPSKPSTFTKDIDLDGMKVAMTMTAAEVDGATFAIGTAQAPDAARAQAALEAMRIALVRNISGRVRRQKEPAVAGDGSVISDIEADGNANGVPMRLAGHFVARNNRFYQVIVIGKTSDMPAEQVEQFLTSFHPL